jgi:hypothetical protein
LELTTTSRSLRDILKAHFFFIPRFQRPYSWTRENVEELWEDAIQEASGEYFIGSMVVYKKEKAEDTKAVIDGQQRLTTLMMLLCALRNAADVHGLTSLANGTQGFIERADENDEDRFVLTTETSYPYLQDVVLSRDESEITPRPGGEERAIELAFDRVTSYADDLVASVVEDPTIPKAKREAALLARLKETRDKILNLRLIFIEVSDRDEATTIFVTLNARGLDLEPADLVKAHLLNLLPRKGGIDKPLARWQSIVDLFDASAINLPMTTFLLTVWRSRHETLSAKKLAKAVRKKIKQADASAFLGQLIADAELYRQIHELEYRKWSKSEQPAVESLRYFRDFRISQPMPLVLALMREFNAGRISLKQLRRGLRAIEGYHFTFNTLANRSSSGGMSLFYGKRARDLLNASDASQRAVQVDDLVAELRGKRPTDAEFDEAFASLWLADGYTTDRKTVRYILARLYEHHQPQTALDLSRMTVEHLSSQSDGSERVGELGNLVLVNESLNGQLANSAFAKKQRLLKSAKEWVPDDVLNAPAWDDGTIALRTLALAAEARTKVFRG